MMRVIGDCSECVYWGAVQGSEKLEPWDRARVLREAENPLMRVNPFTYNPLPNEPEVRRCGHGSLSVQDTNLPPDTATGPVANGLVFSPTNADHDARLCTTGSFGCAYWERRDITEPTTE